VPDSAGFLTNARGKTGEVLFLGADLHQGFGQKRNEGQILGRQQEQIQAQIQMHDAAGELVVEEHSPWCLVQHDLGNDLVFRFQISPGQTGNGGQGFGGVRGFLPVFDFGGLIPNRL